MFFKLDCHDVFTDDEYVNTYRNNRWMPNSVFDKYVNIIYNELGEQLHEGISVLDLGCGTGQFTLGLNNIYGLNIVNIDAVDSSDKNISLLNRYLKENNILNVTTYNTDFFLYNSDKLYDIIICSEMIHLIDDIFSFFRHVYEKLKVNGIFLIRTSTHEQLYSRKWYVPFPRCRLIDIVRHKSKYLIFSCANLIGFCDIESKEVDESRLENKKVYLDRFRSKCFSTLYLIDNAEYERGVSVLEKMYATQDEVLFDYNMTCYILKK